MLARTDQVRAAFAGLIGAQPAEIGFLFSTSEGENIVAHALGLTRGDNVVVDELHYNTSFVLYSHLEQTTGVELRIVKAREGGVTAADFAPHVDRRTKVVSVAWVSHQNGFRHDMPPLADLAHRHGAWLYADAVQAVGMFPIDVKTSGVDVMTTGTYKWLLGSYGVAPFYVRAELLDRIAPDRMGALHVERDAARSSIRDLQDRKEIRLRDAGVRARLSARRGAASISIASAWHASNGTPLASRTRSPTACARGG